MNDQDHPLRKKSSVPRWVWIAVIVGILARILYLALTPLPKQEGTFLIPFNDELAHYHHVLYQRDFSRMPYQFDRTVSEAVLARGDGEYWQPTLYYQLCGYILRIFFSSKEKKEYIPLSPANDYPKTLSTSSNSKNNTGGSQFPYPTKEVVVLRFLSLCFWLAGIFILLKLVPYSLMRTPILLSTLLGLWLPMSATINNDALLWFWICVLYGFATYAARNGLTRYEGLLLCGVFLMAMYTKLSALPLLPMALATIWVGRKHQPLLIRVTELFVAGTLILDLLLPMLYLRNILYGDPLGVGQALPVGLWEGVKAFFYSAVAPIQEWWSFPVVKGFALLLAIFSPIALWRACSNLRSLFSSYSLQTFIGKSSNQTFVGNTSKEAPPLSDNPQEANRTALLIWGIGIAVSTLMWVIYAFYNYQFEARLLLNALPGLGLVFINDKTTIGK